MNRDEEEFSEEEESDTFDSRPPPQDADRDFDDDFKRSDGSAGEALVQNQPFDEAVELSDHGSEQPSPMPEPSNGGGRAGNARSYVAPPPPGSVQNRPHDEEFDVESEASVNDEAEEEPSAGPRPAATAMQPEREEPPRYERRPEPPTLKTMEAQPRMGEMQIESPTGGLMGGSVPRDFGALGSPGGEEQPPTPGGPVPEDLYDASEYAGLDVSPEIAELFEYIGRYKPHAIELETKMRPFVAEYIPAVGEIDPFVKVPRPDGKPEHLGLTVLDETAATQSDPTVLTLQLKVRGCSCGIKERRKRDRET
jgi:intraflagellar transport protein 46